MAFEDFLCAAKGSLTASEIAKIRDQVGVRGMAGTWVHFFLSLIWIRWILARDPFNLSVFVHQFTTNGYDYGTFSNSKLVEVRFSDIFFFSTWFFLVCVDDIPI